MNIHQRINARKLLLSYLYQHCFFTKLATSVEVATQSVEMPTFEQNDPFFDQHFLADIKALWENASKEGERFQSTIAELLANSVEDEFPYYLRIFLTNGMKNLWISIIF
jgi:hypothetical protein